MWRLKLFATNLNNPEFGGSVPVHRPAGHSIWSFLLNRLRRSLTRDGVPIPITGRAFDVLDALAAAAGETLSKTALLDRVWSGRIVEENNLQVHISALRKALSDEWIITVPGRGYRLLLPTADTKPPRQDGFAGRPSIAVLLFANLSGDPAQEYFADGIAHEIIAELSAIAPCWSSHAIPVFRSRVAMST